MKKTFFLLLLGITAFLMPVSAADQPRLLKIRFDQYFNRLEVDDHVTVVLTNESSNEISIEGEKAQAGKIRAAVRKNKLYIWMAGEKTDRQVTVYVPARYLKEVVVNGHSDISTASTLYNAGMVVYVNGRCRLDLHSMGRIIVKGSGDYEFRHKAGE